MTEDVHPVSGIHLFEEHNAHLKIYHRSSRFGLLTERNRNIWSWKNCCVFPILFLGSCTIRFNIFGKIHFGYHSIWLGHLSQIGNVSYLFVVINHFYAPDFDFEASSTFFHCYFLLMASMLLFPILAASLAAGTPISSDKVHPLKLISILSNPSNFDPGFITSLDWAVWSG